MLEVTREDIELELSQIEIKDLTDINGEGSFNQAVFDDCVSDALGFIESFIVIPDNPTKLLKQIAIDLTIYELKRVGGTLNDSLKKERKENIEYLNQMMKGKLPTELNADSSTPAPRTTTRAFRHSGTKINFKGWR